VGVIVLGALLVGSAPAFAQERLHQISWTHTSPSEIRRFVILISPVEGSVADARQVDVGIPESQALGFTNLYSATVSFSSDEFLAVAAIGRNGLMSVPSDWMGVKPSRPGQPLPVSN
jgi:hypothetical protein